METHEFRARVESVKARAYGQWDYILGRLLRNPSLINRKNQPCPKCSDGKDRFQYTDKFGNGDSHCRYCGHIGGFDLIRCDNGSTFLEALEQVEKLVAPGVELVRARTGSKPRLRNKKLAQKIWGESKPVTPGDPVALYLAARGLDLREYPESLRCHPHLAYYENDGKSRKLLGHYPAMIARVLDDKGELLTLHRTYLTEDGSKAAVREEKKPLHGSSDRGIIQLFPAGKLLGVSEGIETGIAAHLLFRGIPVWPLLNATNMKKFVSPDTVHHLVVFGDVDASFTGQEAAFVLARSERNAIGKRGNLKQVSVCFARLRNRKYQVISFSSTEADSDFADVALARNSQRARVKGRIA